MSVMTYNPDMKGTPMRNFLLGLKLVSPLLVWSFEVGRHIPLVQMLRLEATGFNLDLEMGRHKPLIQILSQEDILLIWVIPLL